MKHVDAIYVTPGQGFSSLIFSPYAAGLDWTETIQIMQARTVSTEALVNAIHSGDVEMAHHHLDDVNLYRREMQIGDLFVSLTDAEISGEKEEELGPDGQGYGMFSAIPWRPVVFQTKPYHGAPLGVQQWKVLGSTEIFQGSPK